MAFCHFRWECFTFARNYFHYLFKNYIFLYSSCSENHVTNQNSNKYKLTAIVWDIVRHIFFKHGIKKVEIDTAPYLDLYLESDNNGRRTKL